MSTTTKEKWLVVDGYNLIGRCWCEWAKRLDKGGNETVIPTVFLRTFRKLVADFPSDRVIFITDNDPEHTIRREIYPEYKHANKNRKKDRHCTKQRQICTDICREFLPVTVVGVDGYEADDLAYMICEMYAAEKQITCVSTDEDFLQLQQQFADEGVTIINPWRPNNDPPWYYIPFYKALVGDKSDNIAGVYGIGKTRAEYILQKYPDPEEFFVEHREWIALDTYRKCLRVIDLTLINHTEEAYTSLRRQIEGHIPTFKGKEFNTYCKDNHFTQILKGYRESFCPVWERLALWGMKKISA